MSNALWRAWLSFLLVGALSVVGGCAGCNGDGVDEDGDGFFADDEDPTVVDCDDGDASIHPLAPELCDGIDNDCNELVDEGLDGDGDGYAPASAGCDGTPDCDDSESAVNPGAAEDCNGIDDDCDGDIDEDCTDDDGDGFAVPADCDDTNADIHPDATEVCDGVDNDCDGDVDEDCTDGDGDGFAPPEDCDDTNADIHPDATEVCDGVDQDCDAVIDNGFDGDADSVTSCGADGVADTADDDCDDGDPGRYPGNTETCNGVDDDCADGVPADEVDGDGDGVSACDGDCDDADGANYPGNAEVCDGQDNDCDGAAGADEGDVDGDGSLTCVDCDDADAANFPGNPELCDGQDNDCDGAPETDSTDADADLVALCAGDCDDGNADTYPGAAEICDGQDNDCDGAPGANEVDGDGDLSLACADCDDADAANFPGNTEACDGADNDCDGSAGVDEVDGDGDLALACADCDDLDAANFPGNTEACDGQDNDCDGAAGVDEVDGDADLALACADCDDANGGAFPGNTEACDGFDSDCDGVVTGEEDGDTDGSFACADCDDTDGANFPGNPEQCDGQDNDCDGAAETDATDDDGDGARVCGGDCDDGNDQTFPGATEICDGEDNDCDGAPGADEGDGDGDGSLTCADCDDVDGANFPGNTEACDGQDNDCDSAPNADEVDGDGDGSLACADCDDTDGANTPGATELCDGQDNDCDGSAGVDEVDGDGDGSLACADCDDTDGANTPGATEICDGQDNDCDGFAGADEVDLDNDFAFDCTDCDDNDATRWAGVGATGVALAGGGPILDQITLDAPVDVALSGLVGDLNVAIDAEHTWLADLTISLESPAGTTVVLMDGRGGSNNDLVGTVFDDQATTPVGAGSAPFTGSFQPEEALTAFLGEPAGGTWTLHVFDAESGDTGTLTGFTLSFSTVDAPEACDGIDNDCTGAAGVDEVDGDFDGSLACADCDDQDGTNTPGGTESCDGADNDCDGVAAGDEIDGDGDGFLACAECADGDGNNFPGNTEICDGFDNDCTGSPEANEVDLDTDGFLACAECDDDEIANFPGNAELCDAIDNNCDVDIDEGFDGDADGVNDCGVDGVTGNTDDDCAPGNGFVFPGAAEVCDGLDTDCSGGIDSAEVDGDSDGYLACAPYVEHGAGLVSGGDCQPTLTGSFPGATEVCDAINNDCDLATDEGFDTDNDGYTTCGADGVTGNTDDDCDDTTRFRRPGRPEVCDALDNDCDGLVDIDDSDYDPVDADSDGQDAVFCGGTDCDDGDPAVNTLDVDGDGEDTCGLDGDAGTGDEDCDDNDPDVLPGAQELCDGVDNDCDSLLDGADPGLTPDADADGQDSDCAGGEDCDDNDAYVFADVEVTSGIIRDCEIAIRPGLSTDWYFGRVEQPFWFVDPVTEDHYLYFRGHFSSTGQAIGVVTSPDGGDSWDEPAAAPLVTRGGAAAFDAEQVNYPTVVYAPELAGIVGAVQRPYLLFYTSRNTSVGFQTGLATATSPEGPFEKVSPSGVALTAPVLANGPVTDLDDRVAHTLEVIYDEDTGMLHGWYSGKSPATNWMIFHATSVDGVNWVRVDDPGIAGSPDMLFTSGLPGTWNATFVKNPVVLRNADPTAPDPYEFWLSGTNTTIGYVTGSETEMIDSDAGAVLTDSAATGRWDSSELYRVAPRFTDSTVPGAPDGSGTYWFFYDGLLATASGPYANSTGLIGHIGRAHNYAPEIVVTSPTSGAVLPGTVDISGTVRDSAPDGVVVTVSAFDGVTETPLGTATVAAPADLTSAEPQTTTWSLTGAAIPPGTTSLIVEAQDEAGVMRVATVAVTTP